jgi:BMFP domain-containing protein YqiC
VNTEEIQEAFDTLFRTVHRQGRRVEELEQRVRELEARLSERTPLALVADPQPEAACEDEIVMSCEAEDRRVYA